MAVNQKSLENLKKRSSDEKRKEICSKAGKASAKKRAENKAAAAVVAKLLDAELPKELRKEIKELGGKANYRTLMLKQLVDIAQNGEKDGDRINAIKMLFEYAREDADYEIKLRDLDIKKQRADNEEF